MCTIDNSEFVSIKEFNGTYFQYLRKGRDELEMNILCSQLTFFAARPKYLDSLVMSSIETTQFFLNIHELLSAVDPYSDIYWKCINVLEMVVHRADAKTLLQRIRVIHVLCPKLQGFLNDCHKLEQLLKLLQNLTYGIQIEWAEPYLLSLKDLLVSFFDDQNSSLFNQSSQLLSLSILINICHKNPIIINELIRKTNIKRFLKKIPTSQYGILSIKMCLILSDSLKHLNSTDFKNFFLTTFEQIEAALFTSNVPFMQHIVDFMHESRCNKMTSYFMEQYDFKEPINELLTSIENNGSQDNNENYQLCISLIFQIIHVILLSPNVSLNEIYGRLIHFSDKWISSRLAGATAIDVIGRICDKLISLKHDNVTAITIYVKQVVDRLVIEFESNQCDPMKTVAMLKLFLTNIENSQYNTTNLLQPGLFDRFLEPVFNTSNSNNINKQCLNMYLWGLYLLVIYSEQSPQMLETRQKIMNHDRIHDLIAMGITGTDDEICWIALKLSRYENCSKNISKLLSTRNSYIPQTKLKFTQEVEVDGNNQTCERYMISKTIENRVDELIVYLMDAIPKNELKNKNVSDFIELFNYKFNNQCQRESELVSQLDDASKNVTNLSKRIAFLSSELNIWETKATANQLNQERLSTEILNLGKCAEAKNKALRESQEGLNRANEQIELLEKKITIATEETKEYVTELEAAKKESTRLYQTIKKYEKEIAEQTKQNSILRKNNDTFKEEKQQLDKQLENLSNNYAKATEENKAYIQMIKDLEEKVRQKDETIRSYESDAKDAEDERNKIIEFMMLKNSKRKKP